MAGSFPRRATEARPVFRRSATRAQGRGRQCDRLRIATEGSERVVAIGPRWCDPPLPTGQTSVPVIPDQNPYGVTTTLNDVGETRVHTEEHLGSDPSHILPDP